ncbi:TerC family protein [Dermatophilus congolensis]|nr:TerC family protein [Dermatophilus congolensis]MBO3152967.1 TerC family protein [Dermatophilus congolensis]MBO3160021.1 TerC family protein [Dermatophilus congolensis]MBO3164255.1 TerC family protein [Dermatophilus congolensis]MBO3177799.1 TerC family protein [Dermatophilus congolensis]
MRRRSRSSRCRQRYGGHRPRGRTSSVPCCFGEGVPRQHPTDRPPCASFVAYRPRLERGQQVDIPAIVWEGTIALIVALLAYDFFFHIRKAHIPTLKEAAIWSALYVGIAIAFGAAVWVIGGAEMGGEWFAGYITEKALSVDNLFVFLIIMSSFKVPRADQQKVLLFGIVFALLARSAFIFVGAAAINAFAAVFYIFGAILIWTAFGMVKSELSGEEEDPAEEADNIIVRIARKIFHTTDYYDGDRMTTMVDGKRHLTPMLLVMVAIGGTDLLFALDSIPAIFGLTQNVFNVFTATAFSLMGLRQLYFLIDGLLDRLIYLSWGLSTILFFIGVKLILHAMHENNLPWLNNGEPIHVPEVGIGLSLSVIIGVLAITVIASLLSPKGKAVSLINNTNRHAMTYIDLDSDVDAEYREETYQKMLVEERSLRSIDDRFKHLVEEHKELEKHLAEAHALHAKHG